MNNARGTARRALAGILAGSAWLAWGLVITYSTTPLILAPIILITTALLLTSAYQIRKAPVQSNPFKPGFLIVTFFEILGVIAVVLLARKTNQLDLIPVGLGLVIGLHFFPLAKIFEAPVYLATASAITAWSITTMMLFTGDTRMAATAFGIGSILWATSLFNLTRASTSTPTSRSMRK